MTRRSVVAATLKFGYAFTAVSIIALNASVSIVLQVVVRAFDLEAEAGGEILLVADHHVHVFGDFPVHLLRLSGRRWISRATGGNSNRS